MAQAFRFYRGVVPRLARMGTIRAGLRATADEVARTVAASSVNARLEVASVNVTLAQVERAGWRVQDVGPNAVRREFGNGRGTPRRAFGKVTGRTGRRGRR